MTRTMQNKILDDKIESNINQYKVDRLNAEISAFWSGDLNKYEFLTRKDLKCKPNALDKARFEFSPLGKAFSTGLDKTAVGYQEEGVIKLLKDIRDGSANGVIRLNRPENDDNRPDSDGDDRPGNDDDNRPDNDDDDRPDNDDDNRSDGEEETIVIRHLLNEIDRINDINKQYKDTINNINEKNNDYLRKIKEQNDDIEKLKKEAIDNKKITKDILDETGKKINQFYQERLKYFNNLNYELEKNSELLKKIREKESLINDYIMHIRDKTNEDRLEINVLNRDIERLNQDIERLNNLDINYSDKINKYKERLKNKKEKYDKNIDNLKNDLIDQEYVTKELQKLYENLKDDNKRLSGYVEKHNDLLGDFNILKNDNEITENKLNKSKNELIKKMKVLAR